MLLSVLSIYLATISLSFLASTRTTSRIIQSKKKHLGEILYLKKIYLYDIENGQNNRI